MSKKKDERQFKIRQLLQEHPKIKISDLADYFQTSSETIRKDIIELEDSKIIKKEHGYALLLEEPDEMPISLRNQEYICELDDKKYKALKKEYGQGYDVELSKGKKIASIIFLIIFVIGVFGLSYMFDKEKDKRENKKTEKINSLPNRVDGR